MVQPGINFGQILGTPGAKYRGMKRKSFAMSRLNTPCSNSARHETIMANQYRGATRTTRFSRKSAEASARDSPGRGSREQVYAMMKPLMTKKMSTPVAP